MAFQGKVVQPSIEKIKFETYRFYLECINSFISGQYGSWQTLAEQMLTDTLRLQGMRNVDRKVVAPLLKIAWNSEYILNFHWDDIHLVRANNQWAPIQAYYSVYSCAEAVAYTIDGHRAGAHTKALRKVTEYLVKAKIPPWNLAYLGPIGKSGNDHHPVNFPTDLTVPHNLKRSGVEPIQMIAKCLKAEHVHRVNDLWKRDSGVKKYDFDPGNTGVLHFLYRLRLKCSYDDAIPFITPQPDVYICGFANDLKNICFSTLLYLEIFLARKASKHLLLSVADDYLANNPRAQQLIDRTSYYRKAI